jgi:hypothetical protein
VDVRYTAIATAIVSLAPLSLIAFFWYQSWKIVHGAPRPISLGRLAVASHALALVLSAALLIGWLSIGEHNQAASTIARTEGFHYAVFALFQYLLLSSLLGVVLCVRASQHK